MPEPTIERPPRYALRKGIETVKEKISIPDYLLDRGVAVKHNRARCIVHGGDNPQSFSIDPDKGLWYCHRCNEGGDVLDLYRAVEGGELWEALVGLSLRFGVDLPERPERWHARQDEKAKIREEMRRGLAKVYQRRFYRMFRDPGAHPEDDAALWEAMYPAAYLAATKRVMG